MKMIWNILPCLQFHFKFKMKKRYNTKVELNISEKIRDNFKSRVRVQIENHLLSHLNLTSRFLTTLPKEKDLEKPDHCIHKF